MIHDSPSHTLQRSAYSKFSALHVWFFPNYVYPITRTNKPHVIEQACSITSSTKRGWKQKKKGEFHLTPWGGGGVMSRALGARINLSVRGGYILPSLSRLFTGSGIIHEAPLCVCVCVTLAFYSATGKRGERKEGKKEDEVDRAAYWLYKKRTDDTNLSNLLNESSFVRTFFWFCKSQVMNEELQFFGNLSVARSLIEWEF